MNFQYTRHGRLRRRQRRVPPEAVDLTVRYGHRLEKEQNWVFVPPWEGKHATKCRRFQALVVIMDQVTHDVITVYWDRRLNYQQQIKQVQTYAQA